MAYSHKPQVKAAQAQGSTFDRGQFSSGGAGTLARSQLEHAGSLHLKRRAPVAAVAVPDEVERQRGALLLGPGGAPEPAAPVPAAPASPAAPGPLDDAELDQFDDRDDEVSSSSGASEEEEGGASDSDEEAELARELDKIKRERQEQAALRLREESELQRRLASGAASVMDDSASVSASVGGKRRWDADVVFHGQAKEQPKAKRFINDTIRNDFHRAFLKKYIR
jgi:hypothetical protein